MQEIHYVLILIGAFVVMASSGPATLAIASTSMNQGRVQGLALASGISTGSLFWSCSAAFGFSNWGQMKNSPLDILGMDHDSFQCSYCGATASEWDHLR